MNNISPMVNLIIQALRKSARGLMRDFGEIENIQSSPKNPASFAETSRSRAEKVLLEELQFIKPEYGIILNSKQIKAGNGTFWDVAPLDGFENYVHASPYFSQNVSVLRLTDNIMDCLCSVIYSPILGEIYMTEKGGGAWVERHNTNSSQRLRVSQRKELKDGLVYFSGNKVQYFDLLKRFELNQATVRFLGAEALSMCNFAAGKADILISSDPNYQIFVKEAGGVVLKETKDKMFISVNANMEKNLKAFLGE